MGGGTGSYREMEETELIVLWGSNARETHPIFFHHLLKGVHHGAKLFVVDPRRTTSAQWTEKWLRAACGNGHRSGQRGGARNSRRGPGNRDFVENATSGFKEFREHVQKYTIEDAANICGVPAELIRELAHSYARAGRAQICWTLGITEHHNAVDNVLALINLSLLTGHVGRYGSGLNPLRGQNNVQGGGDMGALPDRLPGLPARGER